MSQEFLGARLDGIRRALQTHALDALLLTDLGNIGYVTGFTGSTAYALVTPHEAIFITDARYTLRARKECPYFEVMQTDSGSGGYPEALKKTFARWPEIVKVGFESSHVTVAQWERFQKEMPETIQWVSTAEIIEELRLIKDAGEITQIRHAIAVAESAFESVKPLLKPGIAEQELALELDFAMRRRGAEKGAFETIVASGPQGARPHHTPNDRLLESGDFVTIDWGATVDGYNSDITRTIGIGALTDRQQQIYATVLEAQRRAINAIAPGRNGKEIDAIARDYLTEQGFGEAFGHSLGHSLGRHVHDGIGFSVRSEKLILQPGMVMTVEPGVYLEDFGGIRIEEDVLVTETGCEILTHLSNSLEILG